MVAPQLAHACRESGDLPCARSTLRSARDGVSTFPPGHRVRGDIAREEALLAETEGRMDDAYRLLSDALAIHEALEGPHLTQVETQIAMSHLQLRRGALADAEARARAALAVAEGFRGGAPHSSWVGRSLWHSAPRARRKEMPPGRRASFTQALAHMTPTLGPDHPSAVEARQALARATRRTPLL
jgi:hypothetical protein